MVTTRAEGVAIASTPIAVVIIMEILSTATQMTIVAAGQK